MRNLLSFSFPVYGEGGVSIANDGRGNFNRLSPSHRYAVPPPRKRGGKKNEHTV